MGHQTQRQHYLHQLAANIQKRKIDVKNRRKVSRFKKPHTT